VQMIKRSSFYTLSQGCILCCHYIWYSLEMGFQSRKIPFQRVFWWCWCFFICVISFIQYQLVTFLIMNISLVWIFSQTPHLIKDNFDKSSVIIVFTSGYKSPIFTFSFQYWNKTVIGYFLHEHFWLYQHL